VSSPIFPMLLIFGVFYFFVLRPQVRERQEHDKLVTSLAKDDRVVTASGVHGTIISVDKDTVVLEIAERTKVVIDKSTVARRKSAAGAQEPAEAGKVPAAPGKA
jgi:preprotein translocase subunit YajC